ATPASDVYSLGASLYYALTGALPLSADNPVAMLRAHIEQAPQPPSKRLRRAVSPALEAIVMRCLAKRADERYPDAGAVADALAACPLANTWRPARASLPAPTATRAADGLRDTVALAG